MSDVVTIDLEHYVKITTIKTISEFGRENEQAWQGFAMAMACLCAMVDNKSRRVSKYIEEALVTVSKLVD